MELWTYEKCFNWCREQTFSFAFQDLWVALAALTSLGLYLLFRNITLIRLKFDNPKTLERVESFLAFASFLLMTAFILLQVWGQ